MTFQELFDQLAEAARSNRDKGASADGIELKRSLPRRFL